MRKERIRIGSPQGHSRDPPRFWASLFWLGLLAAAFIVGLRLA